MELVFPNTENALSKALIYAEDVALVYTIDRGKKSILYTLIFRSVLIGTFRHNLPETTWFNKSKLDSLLRIHFLRDGFGKSLEGKL